MKISAMVTLLTVAFALNGCLSKPALRKETFLFATPPGTKATPSNGPVLALRRISVAPQFNSTALNYRTGQFSFEQDPYAGFLVAPDQSLVTPIRAGMENAGIFSAVTGAGSALKGAMEMEVSVPQLYGDFRDRQRPIAVLEMRFIVVRKKGGEVVFQKDYLKKIPVKTRTAAAVVASLNEALGNIIVELSADLKKTLG